MKFVREREIGKGVDNQVKVIGWHFVDAEEISTLSIEIAFHGLCQLYFIRRGSRHRIKAAHPLRDATRVLGESSELRPLWIAITLLGLPVILDRFRDMLGL